MTNEQQPTQQQLQNENLTLKRVIAKLSQKLADQDINLALAAVELEDNAQIIKHLKSKNSEETESDLV